MTLRLQPIKVLRHTDVFFVKRNLTCGDGSECVFYEMRLYEFPFKECRWLDVFFSHNPQPDHPAYLDRHHLEGKKRRRREKHKY